MNPLNLVTPAVFGAVDLIEEIGGAVAALKNGSASLAQARQRVAAAHARYDQLLGGLDGLLASNDAAANAAAAKLPDAIQPGAAVPATSHA